jgi:L-seryl-tRNA(Ser) seleniumtransferase
VPGDERVIADRLHAILTAPAPRSRVAPATPAPAADLTGEWAVTIRYAASTSTHAVYLRQRGARLDGSHRGEFVSRPVTGRIEGTSVTFSSAQDESHGDALYFTFRGTLAGDTIAGDLDMGEYLGAQFTARRAGSPS